MKLEGTYEHTFLELTNLNENFMKLNKIQEKYEEVGFNIILTIFTRKSNQWSP